MAPEAGVLGDDERVDLDLRDVLVGDVRAALAEDLRDALALLVEEDGDLLRVVVADAVDARQVLVGRRRC